MAEKNKGNSTRINPKKKIVPEHASDGMFPITDYAADSRGNIAQKSSLDAKKARAFSEENKK